MKVGDRIKRTKIIPIRWIDEQHDSDLDGVPNYRDCQPFNPKKQDKKILMYYGNKEAGYGITQADSGKWYSIFVRYNDPSVEKVHNTKQEAINYIKERWNEYTTALKMLQEHENKRLREYEKLKKRM